MKNVLRIFPLFLLPMLVACDEEVKTVSPEYAHDDVESVENLPKCKESIRGTTYYVQDENMKYECDGSKWIKEIVVDTKPSVQSSSSSLQEDSEDSSDSEEKSSSSKAKSSSSIESSSSTQTSSSVESSDTAELSSSVESSSSGYFAVKLWGACTAEREGERRVQNDSLELFFENEFICELSRWRRMVAYDYPLEELFNPDVDYGTLTDSRDGNTYRTVVIGDMEWMAENLRYKIPGDTVFDTGANCFRGQLRYCKTGGYLYSVNDMTEACPEGFLIPNGTAVGKLAELAPYETAGISKAWYNSLNDVVVLYTNSSGLTVLPEGWYDKPTYWMLGYSYFTKDGYTFRDVHTYFSIGRRTTEGEPYCDDDQKCHYIRCYRPLGNQEE